MTSLRVALDYRPALLGRSGIPRAVRELARALGTSAEREHIEIHLFGHSFTRARVFTAPLGTRLHRSRLPGRALPWLAKLGIGAQQLSGNAELFHWTDFVFPPVGRRTRVVLSLHDCAFAVDPTLHGPDAAPLCSRTLAAIARADAVVCPSRASASDARRHLGVPAEKLRVIPFGIDHADDAMTTVPAPPLGDREYVLMLGTIEPRKNHERALRAWQDLPIDGALLVIVGRAGWCCDAAVAAIRAAVASGRALWFSDADDSSVRALIAHARALLYPSLLEGFGFPPLEALARGIPVVAGDTPALRETCGDQVRYCDPLDVESIRAALRSALDPSALAASSRASRRAHASRYRWDDCARAHAALYRELTA